MRIRLSSAFTVAFTFTCIASVNAAPLDEPLRPLTVDTHLDTRKVELGRRLFIDNRLAKDDSVSCASCHDFSHGGADPRSRSIGVHGEKSGANAPSVFNSGFNFRQLWNGSATSLEDFLDKLIKNPRVFDSNWDEVTAKLAREPALVETFQDTYSDGLNGRNIIDALSTYTRSLVTPSRFDRYLRGDENAITRDELQGYIKFKSYGCVACHQGINVGGNMFQKFGVMGDYFRDRGNVTPADMGRFAVTKRDIDKHVFKVPSLRNVELTAPYFHDGSAPTLEAAVEVMFKYQLGRTAPQKDKALIVGFLKTLTGEVQPKLAKPAQAVSPLALGATR